MATRANDGGNGVGLFPERRTLPLAARHRIVELLATFHKVSEVQAILASEFGLNAAPQTIRHYDPASGTRLSRRLVSLFHETRKRYLERITDIGLANQAHRLRRLERIIDGAEKAKDFGNAIKGLELAAKELGGVLEGKTTIRHEGHVEHRHLSVQDARAELAMRLGAVIEGGTLHALPSPDSAQPSDDAPDTVATDPTP